MSRQKRLELLIFIACLLSFAYFNQGGGWNQNARFAEVRAMAEEGTFSIDDFLVYQRDPDPQKEDLIRLPLRNAEYELDGKRYRLCWVDMEWTLYPVGERERPLDPDVEKKAMIEVCSSGDIGYVPWAGHFHPNKPPGTSFLALPGYFVIYHIEKMLGANPDHWWTVELNAWLATIFSVGVISALGCVFFFRLARDLSGGAELASVLATLAFAFGTTFFPFGTIFFDHNLTASLLIAAYYFLRVARRHSDQTWPEPNRPADWCYLLAGLCAGMAAVTNYLAAIAGFFLGLYALLTLRNRWFNWRAAISFSLGVLPLFLLICWYGYECFGSPFKLNTDFQNPLFKDDGDGAFLGMFLLPKNAADWWRLEYVGTYLTISPMRGLFCVSPVLILGFIGFFRWFTKRDLRADVWLCFGIFAWFFSANLLFNGFHGGFSAGPRYLIPGIPFLALPLVVAFVDRWLKWWAIGLGTVSIGINLLLTATDAQNPVGVGGHARVDGHGEWDYKLVGEYAWPLFWKGRDWPLLNQQIALEMQKQLPRIEAETADPAERAKLVNELLSEFHASIERGEPSPFLLGSVEGPVSVNPIGVYEGLFTYELFPPGSAPCRWASCNVGEFLWPQSRLSLLPLLLVSGGLCAWMIRSARNQAPV